VAEDLVERCRVAAGQRVPDGGAGLPEGRARGAGVAGGRFVQACRGQPGSRGLGRGQQVYQRAVRQELGVHQVQGEWLVRQRPGIRGLG
jgi:hypothetical protein